MLKANALLVGDVLPSRANNSANDQDSVQLRILEVVLTNYSRVRYKKVGFSFSAICLWKTWKSDSARANHLDHKRYLISQKQHTLFLYGWRKQQIHLLFRRRQRTLPLLSPFTKRHESTPASLSCFQYGAGNCERVYCRVSQPAAFDSLCIAEHLPSIFTPTTGHLTA